MPGDIERVQNLESALRDHMERALTANLRIQAIDAIVGSISRPEANVDLNALLAERAQLVAEVRWHRKAAEWIEKQLEALREKLFDEIQRLNTDPLGVIDELGLYVWGEATSSIPGAFPSGHLGLSADPFGLGPLRGAGGGAPAGLSGSYGVRPGRGGSGGDRRGTGMRGAVSGACVFRST